MHNLGALAPEGWRPRPGTGLVEARRRRGYVHAMNNLGALDQVRGVIDSARDWWEARRVDQHTEALLGGRCCI